MTRTQLNDVRHQAQELVDALPEDATWEDLMELIYVRQKITAGLQDVDAGRVVDVEEVRRRFGLGV